MPELFKFCSCNRQIISLLLRVYCGFIQNFLVVWQTFNKTQLIFKNTGLYSTSICLISLNVSTDLSRIKAGLEIWFYKLRHVMEKVLLNRDVRPNNISLAYLNKYRVTVVLNNNDIYLNNYQNTKYVKTCRPSFLNTLLHHF